MQNDFETILSILTFTPTIYSEIFMVAATIVRHQIH